MHSCQYREGWVRSMLAVYKHACKRKWPSLHNTCPTV
jgi:hypothetical protein